VTINAATGGPADIESVAYDQTYDPNMIDANYLGDTGISGLGTTVGQASYSFTVPAGHNFVVVVNTTGGEPTSGAVSSQFSGTVSGFINNTAGPGDCAALPPVPDLLSAASRLSHGSAMFDVAMPLNGTGVEPRRGNGNYTAVLHFDRPVQNGNATVTGGTGTAGSPVFSGNDMIVPLSGVTDQQRLTLTATNVTPVSGAVLGSVSVQMGFLLGDTNGDTSGERAVNSGDTQQTRSRSGQQTNGTNFRSDVNRDGTINSGDSIIVRSQSGNSVP
jgi:hypothetical protein